MHTNSRKGNFDVWLSRCALLGWIYGEVWCGKAPCTYQLIGYINLPSYNNITHELVCFMIYSQTSNIKPTLVGNENFGHSDVNLHSWINTWLHWRRETFIFYCSVRRVSHCLMLLATELISIISRAIWNKTHLSPKNNNQFNKQRGNSVSKLRYHAQQECIIRYKLPTRHSSAFLATSLKGLQSVQLSAPLETEASIVMGLQDKLQDQTQILNFKRNFTKHPCSQFEIIVVTSSLQ